MPEVKAEMAATVWRVLVIEGQEVAAGETLILLESMKMEVPVEASEGGTVDRVLVNEGDVVQEGDVLAVLN